MSECLVINSGTNICIFPQQLGLESRPAEVGGIAYVMSLKDCLFFPKLFFFSSEFDLLGLPTECKVKNMFTFMQCIGGSVGRVLRCDARGHGFEP